MASARDCEFADVPAPRHTRARPYTRDRFKRYGRWALSATLLAALVAIVVVKGRQVDWDEVAQALRSYSAVTLIGACAFSALAYLACSGYDVLARRYVQHHLKTPLTMLIAFVSYAVTMNVGALLGGMGLRLRLYTRYGVSAAKVTHIIGLGIVTNWSGYVLLAGLTLVIDPPQLPDDWHLGRIAIRGIGVLLLAILAAYLAACVFWRGREWQLRSVVFECPGLPFAAAQLALSCLNWLSVAAVAWMLMPGHVPFNDALAALFVASLGGLIVRLPAGIGVLEASFFAVLGGSVAHGRLIAALLALRAIYYLIPLMIAAGAALVLELGARRLKNQTSGTGKAPAKR
jgi:uncharacterized membrane protein YbhN (UPF0104 family)